MKKGSGEERYRLTDINAKASMFAIGHVNIGIILLRIGNSQSCLYKTRRNLIGCSTASQEYCKLIGWETMGMQL